MLPPPPLLAPLMAAMSPAAPPPEPEQGTLTPSPSVEAEATEPGPSVRTRTDTPIPNPAFAMVLVFIVPPRMNTKIGRDRRGAHARTQPGPFRTKWFGNLANSA